MSETMRHRCASVMLCLLVAACGGGGGGGSSASNYVATLPSLSATNVAPLMVEAGPGSNVNMPYVTVTVCVPGTSSCNSIDHVLLDTGSTGLRLFASKVDVALPAQATASSSDLGECAHFLKTMAWGRVKLADVQIGGESAASVPIQLMDASDARRPLACTSSPLLSTSSSANTQALSANGILGVGLLANDNQTYFNCAASTRNCAPMNNGPTPAEQVQNPVGFFATNNNGVVLQLPALPATGALRAQGYLIFGVGTQPNNQLGAAKIVPVNSAGFFTTVYEGVNMNSSFMDSGSNGLFFGNASVAICTGALTDFYCPTSARSLSASIQLDSGMANVAFSIAGADTLLAANNYFAFNNLGGMLDNSSFDWGLPFFFGRSVYTVIEQRSVPGTPLIGPFNAFTN